ncbi:hypothetical protein EVAR_7401_1 [Eumeta japonica]|uniref:Uncharacterized protein n=1 Tax=Eumeta variegata TaxID=151549 RepID=A0A4C1V6T2_EUMVA|nr:hypothetical protein EVAR_7401_1 [Eumeta japonica]
MHASHYYISTFTPGRYTTRHTNRAVWRRRTAGRRYLQPAPLKRGARQILALLRLQTHSLTLAFSCTTKNHVVGRGHFQVRDNQSVIDRSALARDHSYKSIPYLCFSNEEKKMSLPEFKFRTFLSDGEVEFKMNNVANAQRSRHPISKHDGRLRCARA